MFDLSTLQLTLFAAFGGFIGFFAFSNKPSMTRLDRCWGLMVSVGIGVILALPVHAYMVDYEICSKKLADMLVGLVGLGMPDLFKTNLPQIQKFLVEKFLNKSAVGKVDHD